ncbi:MAG: ATP-binding protein [Thermoanaerobaculia bacterium]|nr:ATP-binding protein [Thermoanaerobaculia bacterium]
MPSPVRPADEPSSSFASPGFAPARERPPAAAGGGADSRLLVSLRWLIAIRLVVITSVALPYLLIQLASPVGLPTFDILFLLAGFTYVASLVYIALLGLLRERPRLQAGVQFAGDLLLVTGLVYSFGGIGSPFSLFYLVVIMIAAVLVRRRAALLVATAAYILYGGLLTALARGYLPVPRPLLSAEEVAWRLPYNLAVHLVGFYAVALLTAYLAENVRRAEAELEEQRDTLANLEAFHHDVVQSLSTGIVTTDPEGRVTSLNRAALDILGRRAPELLGRPIADLGLFDTAAWRELAARAPAAGHRLRSEAEIARGSDRVPVGYNLSCLTDAHGIANGTVLVFQDLTQWRDLQNELRQKDRMAAIGELAAGLAHEVGNPLAAISGSVQMLSARLPEDDGQRKLFDIIHRESQRLDRTIKGFLRFARPRERSTARFDVAALLAESTELLRNSDEATGRHEFELVLDPPAAQLVGDRDQISQIFWNLARNALRAMPDGGRLTVRGALDPDRYRIEFEDTGRGMSEEQRTRLFEPFRSSFDAGTGIGMAIVYRIVQEHDGRIEVDSRPGRGTRIRVELPTERVSVAAARA